MNRHATHLPPSALTPRPRAAPLPDDERTTIIRPSLGRALAWADILRDSARGEATNVYPLRPLAPPPAPAVAPLRPAPAPKAKAQKAPKAAPPVWSKLVDKWGSEWSKPAREQLAPTPKSVGDVLKRPEWKGSTVTTDETTRAPGWGPLECVQEMSQPNANGVCRLVPVKVLGPLPLIREAWTVLTHPCGASMRLRPDAFQK